MGGGVPKELFTLVREATFDEIYDAIRGLDELELITSANVPQFSRVESAYRVPEVLLAIGEAQEFENLGIYLDFASGKKPTANKKYGENHAKLSTLLDLTDIANEGKMTVVPTEFGRLFCELDECEKEAMAARLMLRIPIIQHLLMDVSETVSISDHLKPFAETTKRRRLPNVRTLVRMVGDQLESGDVEMRRALAKIGD